MRTRIAAAGVALIALLPFVSSAQNLSELQAQIQILLQQVTALEAQLGTQTTYVPSPSPTVSLSSSGSSSGCVVIYRTVSLGASGSDVAELQRFLINRGDLAAGSASGYFGELTRAALQRFQARNGIVSSGTAATTGYGATGPRTRAAIQSATCGSGSSVRPIATPTPVPISGAGIPCIVGNIGVPSGASITLYEQSPSSGIACRAQARQCINGTLAGDAAFRYSTCTVSAPDRCRLDGESVLHGESRVFYEDDSVDFGESCSSVAQSRTCRNGDLSGSSRYKYSSCDVDGADSCKVDGVTVAHNSSRTFYSQSMAPFGGVCSTYGESRKCNNGTLEGNSAFSKASCVIASSASCSLDGKTVADGASATFYSASTGPSGGTCASVSLSRKCTKGVLDGNSDFKYASCAAASCSLEGASVANGASRTFYSASSVDFGGSCSSVALSRTCTNGVLGGNTTYNKASCTVGGQPTASCTLTATPSIVIPDEDIKFSWTSTNATGGTLFGASMSPIAKGTYSFAGYSSTGERTVEFSVSGPGGAGKCSAKVKVQTVVYDPPTCTLTLPGNKTSYLYGDSVTFNWTSVGADYGVATSSDKIPPSGSYTLTNVKDNATYGFTFTGPGGDVTCSKAITVAKTLTVSAPSSGSFQKDSDMVISWQYSNTSARVYLMLTDLNGNQVGNSFIAVNLPSSSTYGWKVPDNLGGTNITNGNYKIRAVAYTPVNACAIGACTGNVVVAARGDSGTISLTTGIAGTVVQNLANALSALESALVKLIGSLGL